MWLCQNYISYALHRPDFSQPNLVKVALTLYMQHRVHRIDAEDFTSYVLKNIISGDSRMFDTNHILKN